MNKEKAEALMKGFPKLTSALKKQMKQSICSWLICDGKIAHCTSCGGSDTDDPIYYLHRKRRECPKCGKEGVVLRNYYNFNGVTLEAENNFVVFQNSRKDDNLYIGCYNYQQYMYKGELKPTVKITETQRYIFTDKQAFRYGKNKVWEKCIVSNGHSYYTSRLGEAWVPRTKLTEPQFVRPAYNLYTSIGYESIGKTCMKHSELEAYTSIADNPIEYLKFYQKHRGAERLLKCGLGAYVKLSVPRIYTSWQGYYSRKPEKSSIDWNQTEPHKMLGVTKDVLDPLREGRITLESYKLWHKRYPEKPIEKLIEYNHLVGRHIYMDALDMVISNTGITIDKLIAYLKKQDMDIHESSLSDYKDYIADCVKLGYDTKDKGIYFPRNFYAAHERVSKIRNMIDNPDAYKVIKSRHELEFEFGDYIVISPKSRADIVAEGKALSHCVGGYADRHVNGKLSIMFLRRKDKPDEPYYTIEVGNNCEIVQCRGYENNVVSRGGEEKPEEIVQFEKAYQAHLREVYAKRIKNAKKARKSA